MDELLTIENIVLHFKLHQHTVKALNGVDLTIRKGEILGLVGETGSGKSMTALAILNLLPSQGKILGGQIRFDDYNLLEKTEEEMQGIRGRQISMIFQNPRESLNPVIKICEQLMDIYRVHSGASKLEAYDHSVVMLQAVGLSNVESLLNSYPHQLSGGMCQRVMIAMALSCNPRLLIADEPTTALDVTVQAEVGDLILDMVRSRGAACLYITHDLGVVAQICDRVAVMYAGRVVESGSIFEIFENPQHPYTQGLIASTLRVDRNGPITVVPGDVPDAARLPRGCPFHPRCVYVMDVCAVSYPDSLELGERRKVACHKVIQGK